MTLGFSSSTVRLVCVWSPRFPSVVFCSWFQVLCITDTVCPCFAVVTPHLLLSGDGSQHEPATLRQPEQFTFFQQTEDGDDRKGRSVNKTDAQEEGVHQPNMFSCLLVFVYTFFIFYIYYSQAIREENRHLTCLHPKTSNTAVICLVDWFIFWRWIQSSVGRKSNY